MNRLFSNASAACLLALTAALSVGGCAGLKVLPPPIEDIAPQREERKQEVVEDFEQRRDESQYQAALAAWERGDTRGCEEQLVQLLRRNPNHHTARQTLADLYLEGQNFPAAEKHYRQLIQDQPRDAQARHSLGLLLELQGRHEEAQQQFAQAAQLEPSNPLFAADKGPAEPVSQASADLPDRRVKPPPPAEPQAVPRPSQAARDPEEAVREAAQLLQAGQPEAALRLAGPAADRHPNHLGLKRVVATAQLESGQLEAAQVTLTQAISLDKTDALTYFLLGVRWPSRAKRPPLKSTSRRPTNWILAFRRIAKRVMGQT